MNDVYVEYATGTIPVPVSRRIYRNLIFTSGILLLLYSVLFYPILWTFALVFFVWGYYYNRNSKYEYEYLLLNNELHVDKIIASLKRKKAFRADLSKLVLFTNSAEILHQFEASQKKPVRIRRFNNPTMKTYALVLNTDKGLICLYLNGDEEFVQAIRRLHPLQTRLVVKEEPSPSKKSDQAANPQMDPS